MMDCYNEKPRVSTKMLKKFGKDVDASYAWYLSNFIKTDERTKAISNANENANANANANASASASASASAKAKAKANANENETEDEDEDENDKDGQYSMFLKRLTGNGKSYKLKISKKGETPDYLNYEESDGDGDKAIIGTTQRDKRKQSAKKRKISKVTKKKKINEHKSITEPNEGITVESCYQMFLNGSIPSEYCAYKYEGKIVRYEEKVTSSNSDSDSDIEILDNVKDFNEVNNKQLVPAQKELSLKEKLIQILEKPYSKQEYEQLSAYLEEKKPICRLLPLRRRSISSALDGVKKSVLDDSPASFRRKLKVAQDDGEQHKALNLLRMFSFWLEHLPNEDVFEPWLDNECLQVLPKPRTK